MAAKSPSIDIELFSDEAIADPYPLYEQVRNAGAVVWLEPYDMWAISRFEDVRAALRADSILLSGKGVAMNDALNNTGNTNTLVSDGEEHRRLRSALMKPMMPSAVRDIRERVQQLSDELVERLLAMDSFDGMSDFSSYLPVSLISVLIGLPPDGRARMLEWAGAAFNALGPMNERAQAGLPGVMEAGRYVLDLDPADLPPQGWAAGLFRAADEGKIDLSEARKLVFDYIIPSLDTTILGAGHLLYQLGRNPGQFDKVKNDRSLIPAAVHEALRIGSPVRAFTRLADANYEAGEVFVPAGDRVVILYAAANHDERRYALPAVFDIERDARDHVAFGYGVHRCAGAHLAELEMQCLLDAMARKVTTIDVEDPTPFPSNMLAGFSSFRASIS
ncbi:MAG: cytochrome P450 [Acidimicrobiaceae bacterium]|nr:cytochrome P450 [Acidimicrobiaceae bacterium]